MRRGVTRALLACAALLLGACTGAATPGAGSSKAGTTSATPGHDPSSSASAVPAVADRLPGSGLASELSYKVRKLKDSGTLLYPSVRFTDQYVVAATATNRLRVIDRTTMKQAWTRSLPYGDQHVGVCTLPELARDATTVTVFIGLQCNTLMTFDLATGKVVEKFLGDTIAVEGYGLVGETLYWAGHDSVNMIDDTGHNVRLLDLFDLGLRNQYAQLLDATTDDDTDQMVIGVNLGRGIGSQQLLGLDLDGIDSKVAWKHDIKDLGLPKSFHVVDVLVPDRPGGLIEAKAPHDRFAFGTLDPETGSMADHYVIPPSFLPHGLPGLLDDAYDHDYLIQGDDLYANLSEAHSHGFEKIVKYDLARHRVAWEALVPFLEGEKRAGYAINVVPLALAGDGGHLYGVLNAGAAQQDLFELDTATGRQTGRWVKLDDHVLTGEVAVDGDLVVEYQRTLYLKKEYELDVKRAS